jgi:dUTP pyrophosphatase
MATVRIQKIDPEMPLPEYAHSGDAGLDLRSTESVRVPVNGRVSVGCGVAVAIPPGYAGLVLPRSGLAFKHGITLTNAPGLIDSGFRGEIRCSVINHGVSPVELRRFDRIAQLVITPVPYIFVEESHELPESVRGAAGFGSTGAQ